MNCGCNKDLGFIAVGDTIDFGINYPYGGFPADFNYIFEVKFNGNLVRVEQLGGAGLPVTLVNTFSEDADVCVKIHVDPDENPLPVGSGLDYLTSEDGACCFCFRSIQKVC